MLLTRKKNIKDSFFNKTWKEKSKMAQWFYKYGSASDMINDTTEFWMNIYIWMKNEHF